MTPPSTSILPSFPAAVSPVIEKRRLGQVQLQGCSSVLLNGLPQFTGLLYKVPQFKLKERLITLILI